MKKLMVALSAVALAFGVHAAETWATGTGFEGDVGELPANLSDHTDVGELNPAASWTIPTLGEGESLLIKSTAGETMPAYQSDGVPAKYKMLPNNQFLDIHTKLGNPVTRNINQDKSARDIDNGIYFDSLVKITACDTVPEADYQTDAKLLVYALENEDTGATNLFIRAGQIQANDTVTAVDYDCGEFTYAGQWVRLTIKAIDDVLNGSYTCPGFVVFFGGDNTTGVLPVYDVNGTAKIISGSTATLTPGAAAFGNALFPAIVGNLLAGSNNSKLTGVAFDGQGAVDDIVFNDAAPFQQAQDKQFATLAWDDGVTGFTCSYDSVDYSKSGLTGAGSVDIVFNPDSTSLEVTGITYADGKFGDSSKTFDPIAADQTYTLTVKTANVTIGDQKFETFAEAITYINGATASGDLVVNFAVGFEPEDFSATITPGADVTSLTIDLAGQTLTYTGTETPAIACAVPLTINDSSDPDAGKIEAASLGEGIDMISCTADLTITGGIFDGTILCFNEEEAPALVVTGGKFLSDDETGFYLWDGDTTKTYGDKTYEATYAEGYWTVTEKQIKTFKIMVVVNGETVQEKDVEENAEFTPETPTLKGWQKLDGWKDGAGADVEFPVTVTAAATYTAQTSLNLTKDDDAYQIGTAAELQILQAYVADAQDTTGLTFKQTGTINLAGIAWDGIGTYVGENDAGNRLFCGVYNGNNETIENVTFAKKLYNGLFGNLGGAAQVKNLTIEVAGLDQNDEMTTDYGFGAAAGYAMGTDVLLENITVNPAVVGQASICGTHNMAGIGARLAGKITLKDCTNNLDISTTYSKIGGMCAIASQRDATGAIEFNGCVNNGTITGVGCTKTDVQAGSDGLAGILGYIQDGSKTEPKAGKKSLSIINCENNGTLQHTGDEGETKSAIASFLSKAEGGGLTIVTLSGNKAKADYAAVYNFSDSGVNPDGLNFATVDSGIATFIADADVAKGTATSIPEFKVMTKYAAWSDTAFKNGDAITFDRTLFTTWTATVTDGTNPVEPDTSVEGKITYKLAAQQGWPEDPTDWNGKKASEMIPGIPAELENADAGTIAKWATTEGNVDFKNAAGIVTDAFLLNIDNASTPEAIQEAKDAFKITAITVAADGTVTITAPDEANYNGKVTVEGKEALTDLTWHEKTDGDQFFRATLTVKEIAE